MACFLRRLLLPDSHHLQNRQNYPICLKSLVLLMFALHRHRRQSQLLMQIVNYFRYYLLVLTLVDLRFPHCLLHQQLQGMFVQQLQVVPQY